MNNWNLKRIGETVVGKKWVKNFPNVVKFINSGSSVNSSKINRKKTTSRPIIVKLSKTKTNS